MDLWMKDGHYDALIKNVILTFYDGFQSAR
jgi:hypothetical protein